MQKIDHTSNDSAQRIWNKNPLGSRISNATPGSEKYFAELRRYRYDYETPFISRLFRFKQLNGMEVLEVGTGNGIDAVEMLKHGAIYTGIDITAKHIELTAKNLQINGHQAKLIHRDLLEIEWQQKFDCIYSFGVTHHIAHEEAYFKVFYSLLHNDGKLMLALYSKHSVFNFYLLISYLIQNRAKNTLNEWRSYITEQTPLNQPVVIKIRSKREIKKLLQKYGFNIERHYKRGFVQNYLPFIGKYFKPDGKFLNALGSLLGWYHIIIAKKIN